MSSENRDLILQSKEPPPFSEPSVVNLPQATELFKERRLIENGLSFTGYNRINMQDISEVCIQAKRREGERVLWRKKVGKERKVEELKELIVTKVSTKFQIDPPANS